MGELPHVPPCPVGAASCINSAGWRACACAQRPPPEPRAPVPACPSVAGLDATEAKEKPYIASMGIYVFRKELMCRLLREKGSSNDFGGEIIPAAAKDHKVGRG